ncbi:MAG: DUF1573 domain-containing protein [Syntrophomonadaceae bacterium]|nr:DUF1573 domain-containing protein [Syntrophomonadaceae bacterium]
MRDLLCDGFQDTVDELLIRHYSILDILSKLGESSARLNRAIVKSVTSCGCCRIDASKLNFPEDISSVDEIKAHLDHHLHGQLCQSCEDIVFDEMGKLLFYTAALCNTLNISLYDVFLKEYKSAVALGVFNMR